MIKTVSAFSSILLCAATAVSAGESMELPSLADTMAKVASATNYTEAAISPDGRWVSWAQSSQGNGQAASVGSAIYLASVAHPQEVTRVTAAVGGKSEPGRVLQEKSVAWERNGASFAFLSDAEKAGQLQLYVMRSGDHSIRQLTHLQGFLAAPGWSPDGKKIAFLFTENAARAAGPLEAVPQETGVIGQRVFEQRIATVDLDTGVLKQVSPADLYVYEYDWSPNGSTFAVTAAHGSGDNNWYVAEIYLVDCTSGATHSILKTDMQIAVPRWSSDGQRIAFIGGLMSDESIASGDLYVIPAAGGRPMGILTLRGPGSTFWFAWLPRSQGIIFADALWRRDRADRGEQPHRRFTHAVARCRKPSVVPATSRSVCRSPRTARPQQSFADPSANLPASAVGKVGDWRPVTLPRLEGTAMGRR